jgi:hypothetical protein
MTDPSFARDVRPSFRDADVDAMSFAFDLRSYEDVSEHAVSILSRIEAQEMPCDAPWPPEQIDLLRRWIAAGCPR